MESYCMGLSGNRIGYPMLPPIPMDMFLSPLKLPFGSIWWSNFQTNKYRDVTGALWNIRVFD